MAKAGLGKGNAFTAPGPSYANIELERRAARERERAHSLKEKARTRTLDCHWLAIALEARASSRCRPGDRTVLRAALMASPSEPGIGMSWSAGSSESVLGSLGSSPLLFSLSLPLP